MTSKEKFVEEMMEEEVPAVSFCRLCADILSSKMPTPIPLYSEDRQEEAITKQINQLVADLILPDDGLPQEVCVPCSKNVEFCLSFMTKIIETQSKLRRLIQSPKSKKSINEEEYLRNEKFYESILNDADDVTEGVVPGTSILDVVRDAAAVDTENHSAPEVIFDDNVDELIELLVVHPDGDVDIEGVNNILETTNKPHSAAAVVLDERKHAVINLKRRDRSVSSSSSISSSSKRRRMRLTGEQDNDDYEEDEEEEEEGDEASQEGVSGQFAIKDEPNEFAFAEEVDIASDEIIELPVSADLQVKWISEDHECETSYQTHAHEKAAKEPFYCDLCDKVFKSKLVFQLHYTQHKKSTLCQICNSCFLDYDGLVEHMREKHPYLAATATAVAMAGDDNTIAGAEELADSVAKQCDVCGKITENLKQHKIYHAIKELEYCKAENKKFLKKWFYCQRCNKKIFSEANFLFHVAKHNGEDTVPCKQCSYVAMNIQDYNMHITTHTGGKYFICNDCEKCFFTRSAISDHVLIHMEGTRYMCEICGKRFKTSRSNAQHKLLQHKKYFRCNRCNRGFTHESKLKGHYNICQVINQGRNELKVFEPVEKFFCNICNSNIKSSSEVSILFHKAKHEGKDGVECRFCNLLCKNACMYKNHLLIHTNQRPYACTQCSKSFRTKGCLVQHMLVHGNEYKYTCEYCGKKSKKLTTHVNHVNIHTDTKPYKCPDCDRPFRQLSDMKKHRRTHLKYKPDTITITELPYMTIKTEVEDMIAAESIQQIQLT